MCVALKQEQCQNFPESRAALSLLAYCYYHQQLFVEAAEVYERLMELYPSVEDYHVYHAQSLFQAGMYEDANRAVKKVEAKELAPRVALLQGSIKFEQDDMEGCKVSMQGCTPNDPTTVLATGVVKMKEGHFDDAIQCFEDAMEILGFHPSAAYNIALCFFHQKQYDEAKNALISVVNHARDEHGELFDNKAGNMFGGAQKHATILQETYIVEATNLLAAIAFEQGHIQEANEVFDEMPQRPEEELDAITLHNQTLLSMDSDPTSGFRKLRFLLRNPPFPRDALGNLLLLLCKDQKYMEVAQMLYENTDLMGECLSSYLHDFVHALVAKDSSPEEAFEKLDVLEKEQRQKVRTTMNQYEEQSLLPDGNEAEIAKAFLDDEMSRYLPIAMAKGVPLWQSGNFQAVEQHLLESADLCRNEEVWNMNMAHACFMQGETKYKDAIKFYLPVMEMKAQQNGLLDVSPIVMANLCVSYILTKQTDLATEIIHDLEDAEEKYIKKNDGDGAQALGSCVVNLVIGTMYCQRGTFQFGINRIREALQPFARKMSPVS
jgi:tetratricopeptide repeat protein 30